VALCLTTPDTFSGFADANTIQADVGIEVHLGEAGK
jgi:hypothetical protein